jgi:hypothetical protein
MMKIRQIDHRLDRLLRGLLIGITLLAAAPAFADDLEEQDPVRVAEKLKDCTAENLAKHDGRSKAEIRRACRKAIADGSYSDPNLTLDGMRKTPSQQ